jgi:tripartite-type tricarboxylate transporter receptor subunit TctC
LGSLSIGGLSAAQAFPGKPITLVLPFSAGGISDVMARALGQHMAQQLGKPVIVDNKPGAGGQIAASAVLQQAADGHTVYVAGTAMFAINQRCFASFPTTRQGLRAGNVSGHLSSGARGCGRQSCQDAERAGGAFRSSKQGLTFASQGLGSIGHLLGELFRSKTGGSMSHVAYKGSVPALQDVMTNRVDFMFDPTSSTEALIRGRKLRALAIASARRSPQLPDVPTMAELGVRCRCRRLVRRCRAKRNSCHSGPDIEPCAGHSLAGPGHTETLKARACRPIRKPRSNSSNSSTARSHAGHR